MRINNQPTPAPGFELPEEPTTYTVTYSTAYAPDFSQTIELERARPIDIDKFPRNPEHHYITQESAMRLLDAWVAAYPYPRNWHTESHEWYTSLWLISLDGMDIRISEWDIWDWDANAYAIEDFPLDFITSIK